MRDQMPVRDRLGMRERVTQRFHMKAFLFEELEILKFNRETGEKVGHEKVLNAIQTTGKDLFLDVVFGGSTTYMNQANTSLVISGTSGTGTLPRTLSTADSGYPQSPAARQMRWQWSDISADTYTVTGVEVRRGATVFSTASPSFSGGNSKPNTENWIYRYTVTISGGSQFTEPVAFGAGGNYPGLHWLLRRLIGDSAAVSWASLHLIALTSDDYNNDHATLALANGSRTGQTFKWIYVSDEGEDTGGPWEWILIQSATVPQEELSAPRLRISQESWGNKASNAAWTIEYEFSV